MKKENKAIVVDSKGFWRWCITLRITGFLDFFPLSGILETRKHDVSETGSISETSCFLVSRIPDDGKSPKIQ
jgi:hypothetical protein